MARKRRRARRQEAKEAGERGPVEGVWGRWDAAASASLVVLVVVFFWRAATLRGVLLQSDICYQFEPLNAFLHESLRAGRLPLWTPDLFCGYPVAAEGQIAAFYPPALLLAWLLPSSGAINWQIIFHAMVASLGMYGFARRLRLAPFSAWLSALVFGFSGYFFAHIHHVGLFRAASWLPVTLWLVDRAWEHRILANGALAAAGWAACALCGHPQTLFFLSLAVTLWLMWRAATSPQHARGIALRRAAGLLALVFALGLGLSAVQLLLTAELQSRAPHGEVGSLEYVTSFSLLPKHLLGLVAPNWQGTPAFNTYRGEAYYWEYVLYLGIAPLLLAVVGGTHRRGRLWVGVAFVALLLALAQGNPIYQILRFVPGFAHFRAPARYVYFLTFAGAILAGWGWERLRNMPRLRGHPKLAACTALIIAVAALADLWHFDRELAPLANPQVLAARPRVVEVIQNDTAWGRSFIIPPINLYADWSPPGGWAGNPDGWLEARVYLPADVPQSFDLPIVGGYAGFVDPRHAAYFDGASVQASQTGRVDLYSVVGTRHFAVPPTMALPELPSTDVPPFRVSVNEAAFPRVFAARHAVIAADSDGALQRTFALARDAQLRETVVARGLSEGWQVTASDASIIGIEERRPEHIMVRARADGDTLVVLNERWDPGWIAAVDQQTVPLAEVDGVIMGAPISAGEHTVEFRYQPSALIVGRLISLLSLAVLVALVAVGVFHGRGARHGSDG